MLHQKMNDHFMVQEWKNFGKMLEFIIVLTDSHVPPFLLISPVLHHRPDAEKEGIPREKQWQR